MSTRTPRRALYDALFTRLAATPGIVTASRVLQPIAKVDVAQQPALFLPYGRETLTAPGGGARHLPPLRRYELDAHLYVHADACGGRTPADVLADLLDALEAQLAPDNGDGACTLGGLVSHCRVAGTIATDEGELTDQSAALVPIEIVPFP